MVDDKVGSEAWDIDKFGALREGPEECWGWW